jgi:hypothetical protein
MLLVPLLLLALPDPVQIIHTAVAANAAQAARKEKFTWREDEVRNDEKGVPIKGFRRTYDVIMLEGDTYRKLITIDGGPLDAKMQKKVDEDMEKTRQQRKSHRLFHVSISSGGLGDLEKFFDSKVTGEETVNGRKAWRVESEPKAGIKPANGEESDILSSRRVTWFDEGEGFELRRVTTYIRNTHHFQAGTQIEEEWSKVGDAWLSSSLLLRWHLKFLPGIAPSGTSSYRYYDYKRFSSESTFTPN